MAELDTPSQEIIEFVRNCHLLITDPAVRGNAILLSRTVEALVEFEPVASRWRARTEIYKFVEYLRSKSPSSDQSRARKFIGLQGKVSSPADDIAWRVMSALRLPEDAASDAEGIAAEVLPEGRWRDKNIAKLHQGLSALMHRLPHEQDTAVFYFLFHLCITWNCYRSGAAGAYFDVINLLNGYGLSYPRSVQDHSITLISAALKSKDRSGVAGRSSLPAHRKALIQRIRFECVSWVLHSEQVAFENPEVGIVKAVGIAARLMPVFAKSCGTEDALYRTFAMYRKRQLQSEGGLLRRAHSLQEARRWPGKFYLPSREVCIRLGWTDLFETLTGLGVTPDDPLQKCADYFDIDWNERRLDIP